MKALSLAVLLFAGASGSAAARPLAARFADPPASSRLQAWFHWNGDCVTEEGLVADLKAMGEMEIGTAHVFLPAMAHLPATAKPLTPEWFALWRTAIREAKRNNLTLGFHNCPGWSSSGGPWITPENAMKMVVASETDVAAGARTAALPRPTTLRGFYRDVAVLAFPIPRPPRLVRASGDFPGDFAGFCAGTNALTLPLGSPDARCELTLEFDRPSSPATAVFSLDETQFYAKGDVAASADGKMWTPCGDWRYELFNAQRTPKTLRLAAPPKDARFFRVRFQAIPTPPWVGVRDKKLTSFAFTALPRVENVDAKNSASTTFAYQAPAAPAAPGLPLAAFVDLTPHLRADGALDLAGTPLARAPSAPGADLWRVLRIGYTATGKGCAPATLPGLECDKLSKKGLDAHWPHMPQRLLDEPGAKDVVTVSIIDSYEVGGQNWTEAMPDEFRARRGYALTPWLPALLGYVVESAGETAKFLYDFQRTVSDLFAENYYDYFAALCRRAGVRAACEPYGGPFDSLRCGARADVPTGEFWLGRSPHGSPRLAASIGHLNGRAQIAAEAFTTEAKEGRWQITPAELRRSGDAGWLDGVSQLVYHSYLHQPFPNAQPGISLGRHGTQLNRFTTWWPEGVHWSRYVRRGQFLLQSGKPRAEVLVFAGESRPNGGRYAAELVAAGGNFDFCGVADLARLTVAEGGGVAVPGGLPYDVLYLGEDRYVTTATLRTLKALADAGARIAGAKPRGSPSRADDPQTWQALADALWASGRVKGATSARQALAAFGLRTFAESQGALRAIRRVVEGRDVYFVVNPRDAAFAGDVSFAATGAPELWEARDGSTRPLAVVAGADAPGRVKVRLALPAQGSCFVVFDPAAQPVSAPSAAFRPAAEKTAADLSADWTVVSFTGKNAPAAPLKLAALASWSAAADLRLKYFAGRAVYEKTVARPPAAGRGLVLDLGTVRDVVNVWANGRFLGCLWEAPYRVALPADLLGGEGARTLALRLEVVNTWPNRLIGDARARKAGAAEPLSPKGPWPQWVLDGRPDSGTGIYTWSNFMGWSADEELLPAGLLGPVRLVEAVGGDENMLHCTP